MFVNRPEGRVPRSLSQNRLLQRVTENAQMQGLRNPEE